jgi:hypothetical protein
VGDLRNASAVARVFSGRLEEAAAIAEPVSADAVVAKAGDAEAREEVREERSDEQEVDEP